MKGILLRYRESFMKRFIQAEIIFYLCLIILSTGGFFFAVINPTIEGFYAFLASVSLGGIGVAGYIYYAKNYQEHLACPVGSDCNVVIKSRYSVFFGVPLEYWGMLYYVTIFCSYLAFLITPALRESLLLPTVLFLTAGAFLFSIYLTFIQGFVLRAWCIWCLLSASLSTIIFIASLSSIQSAGEFLASIIPLLEIAKVAGFMLGIGTATATVFVFFKFLRDFTISDGEAGMLKAMTELIWFGFGLTLLSEYARFVADPATLSSSSAFRAQIIALSVVFVSGAALKILFAPFLAVVPFEKERHGDGTDNRSPLEALRRAMLMTGTVAVFSWYFAFATNYMADYRLIFFLSLHVAVVCTALTGVLLWERTLSRSRE